jgi:CheY-like chemotaxis protein
MVNKILIIEDDPIMIINMVELLSLEGYEVYSVEDGSQALQGIYDFQPDLILSDILMPGTDGYAILNAVRQDPRIAATPFVFMTGETRAPDELSVQPDDVLIKPFEIHELLGIINHFLGS